MVKGDDEMSQIQIIDLTFSYDTHFESIFEHVSVLLDTDWRTGLIGRNGTGKTTFLKLLSGAYPYRGRIRMSETAEYFPVDIRDVRKSSLEVLEEIDPDYEFWRVLREMEWMGMDSAILERPYGTLSPGERIRLQLAVLFAKEHAFLLIDEPTNHLDEEGRQMLASYLSRKKGFLLVSHDRRLLDACTDHTMAIERSSIRIYKGSFQTWQREKSLRDQAELEQNQKLKKEIRHLEAAAREAGRWAGNKEKEKIGHKVGGLKPDRGAIGHKAAKMMKRSKVLEHRMEKAAKEKAGLLKDIETVEELKMFPLDYEKERLVSVEGISFACGDRQILKDFSLEIRRGDRIALKGPNGCGKTTILKLIAGIYQPDEGRIQTGSGLKISVVSQDSSEMRGTLAELEEEAGLDKTLFRAVLRKLDFSRDQFDKRLEEYSEGQRKKVLLAKSLCEPSHLYIWDEPLNYIDIFTRIQIENLILERKPSMIFVEHDSVFTERIAKSAVRFEKDPQSAGFKAVFESSGLDKEQGDV